MSEQPKDDAAECDDDVLKKALEVAHALRSLVNDVHYPELFRIWEELGLHISRVHFYSAIPEVSKIRESVWRGPSHLHGIDMNDSMQISLLKEAFPKFQHEYNALSRNPTNVQHEYYFENGMFGGTDALVLYCMIRHFAPKRIIEVGSGFSSRLSAMAALKNGSTKLLCIEPYPSELLREGFPGLHVLMERQVQDVDPALFKELSANDVLFIDSSHVSKIGSDVNYLFFEVIPQLSPGVLVHIHDIFLPFEYPKHWVQQELRFWTEQYLLRAFLQFNRTFKVLFANSYIEAKFPDLFRKTFPQSPWWGGGSFWMRRVDA